MPAVLDDPSGSLFLRHDAPSQFLNPAETGLPSDVSPRQVTLRDRQTVATIIPLISRQQLPRSLLVYLCDQLNREIDGGDTYPFMEPFSIDAFADYWFQTFGAVMLLGNVEHPSDVTDGHDWARECLGSFFIKPNYPGRSSHICNGSFIVTDGSRNRGVGRLMGEAYIDWAPRLGYTYSVFNLVYETNVVSCRIWDGLGFKRIGRVKACGNLRSHPDRLIDTIIYGRDLGGPGAADGDELVSDERFDKIRYYLKYCKYPNGADRAEKSRLRSAATHYKLVEGDKLMLKDKEVIADPILQHDIARRVHALRHGGINKTTATIAEKYHWSRIKETVSDVIRACAECKELGKSPNPGGGGGSAGPGGNSIRRSATSAAASRAATRSASTEEASSHAAVRERPALALPLANSEGLAADESVLALQGSHQLHHHDHAHHYGQDDGEHDDGTLLSALSRASATPESATYANPSDISVRPSHDDFQRPLSAAPTRSRNPMLQDDLDSYPLQQRQQHQQHALPSSTSSPIYQPIDPQMINGTHEQSQQHDPHTSAASLVDDDELSFDHYPHHAAADFQALNATEESDADADAEAAAAAAAVERDLEMLIEQEDESMEDAPGLARRLGKSDGSGGDGELYDVAFDT